MLSMNVRSIRPNLAAPREKRFDRVERMLSVIDEEVGDNSFIALAMLQETWLKPNKFGD